MKTTKTKPAYHLVDLCLVRTSYGALNWVKAPAYSINVGDLISFQPGYSLTPCIGAVEDRATVDDSSDTYRLISRYTIIRESQRIFSPTWEKEEQDGNEP